MKLPIFGSLALMFFANAAHAELITMGTSIASARKALVAGRYVETGLEVIPKTKDTALDFWAVDEGVLILSHSTLPNMEGGITRLSYTLTDERPKSTRKTFDFDVESFDTTTGKLILNTKPRSVVSSSDLHSLIGKQVHLEGRFCGPGKLADFVTTPAGQIYLFNPVVPSGEKLSYGSTIAVDGVLGYGSYPPSPPLENGSTAPVIARPPDHFYIDEAKVRGIRPATTKPEQPNPLFAALSGASDFRTWNNRVLPKSVGDEVLGVLNRYAATFAPTERDCRTPKEGPMLKLAPSHVASFTNAANETVSVELFVFSEKYSVLQLEVGSKPKRFFKSMDNQLLAQFSAIMRKESLHGK